MECDTPKRSRRPLGRLRESTSKMEESFGVFLPPSDGAPTPEGGEEKGATTLDEAKVTFVWGRRSCPEEHGPESFPAWA